MGEVERDESTTLDRRRFLRKAGIAAWGAPVILSVWASPAHATTCLSGAPGNQCPCTVGGAACTNGCCCHVDGVTTGTCRSAGSCAPLVCN